MTAYLKTFCVGTICAAGLAMASPAGAVIVGFGDTTTTGLDPLGHTFSTDTLGLSFDMAAQPFNTGFLTPGDGMDVATIFQLTLNNGVANGIKVTPADTFFTDITTGKTWAASFFTVGSVVQRVTFTAPAGTHISPNDIFKLKISYITPLDVQRYSWSANWDNTVPEPAVWALMIAGFGLAGAALRRRRALTA
jgi:hypothetical protein